MCALIQAVRKVGIVGGGPGVGEAKNPMYVIKTIGELPSSDDSRPNTSSSHKEFVNNGAMGGKRRMAEDPATQVDDDRPSQQGFTYYAEEDLNKQLSGTTEEKERVSEERVMRDTDIDRGKSLGKRRKQVQDLEKGPQR
jgi:hypothetical protein